MYKSLGNSINIELLFNKYLVSFGLLSLICCLNKMTKFVC